MRRAVSSCSSNGNVLQTDHNQNIQVFVRVRPINSLEITKNSHCVIDVPGNREVVVTERTFTNLAKTFTFDRVFGPHSEQIDVYKSVVSPLLEQVLLGYNCTVFAYGQTGTGKTFTMEGERSVDPELTWENDPLCGIVPRALSQLFDELPLSNSEFSVRVSLVELYNEELYDLLCPEDNLKPLKLYDDTAKKGSVVINGLEEFIVHNKNEVYHILQRGQDKRRTASTTLNATSSRSHLVLTVTVNIKEASLDGDELVKIGKLNFVDLAGSENIGRSGAVKNRAREAGSINQSLLTLGRVISALVEKTPHVPYRESKLTRLLQDSLGGRTKTSIIATISPASFNLEETLSTLDYAHRAKNIMNRPEINQRINKKAVIKGFIEEIDRLKKDLIAARAKNGIYLDKDNYTELVNKIGVSEVALAEKIGENKGLNEIITAKENELSLLKLNLNETKEDLLIANRVINETQHKLTQTQKATQEKASNLDILYKKLDRKKKIEEDNFTAGHHFSKELTNKLETLRNSFESFRADHASFCGTQRMKLEIFLKDKDTEFTELMKEIMELQSKVLDYTYEAGVIIENNCNNPFLDYDKKLINEISKVHESNTEEINTFSDSTIPNNIKILTEQINTLRAKVESIVSTFNDQLSSQSNLISQYVTQRIMKLEENRKSMEDFLERQMSFNQKAVDGVEIQQKTTENYVKNLQINAANLMNQCQKMVENAVTFKTSVASNASCLISNLVESKTDVQCFINAMKHGFDMNRIEINLLRSNAEERSSQATGLLNADLDSILSLCVGEVQEVEHLKTDIQTHVQAQRDCWCSTIALVTNHNDTSARNGDVKRSYQDLTKKTSKHLKTKVSNLSQNLQKHSSKCSNVLSSVRNDIFRQCNAVSDWTNANKQICENEVTKVNEFWDLKYKLDVPEGKTPQRYPKRIPLKPMANRSNGSADVIYEDGEGEHLNNIKNNNIN